MRDAGERENDTYLLLDAVQKEVCRSFLVLLATYFAFDVHGPKEALPLLEFAWALAGFSSTIRYQKLKDFYHAN